jgi:hypothetical protein
VRNVAQSVIRGPYVVFTIELEDEERRGRSLRRRRGDGDGDAPGAGRERERGSRRPRWLRRGTRIDDQAPPFRKGRRN